MLEQSPWLPVLLTWWTGDWFKEFNMVQKKKTLISTSRVKNLVSVILFIFWSCRTISSFQIPLLLVRMYYFLMCIVLWPISQFCVPLSYFLPCSCFLRIFLLLKILLFCFSSKCLPPTHYQINLTLDNAKYLVFYSPSHTCPHSTCLLMPSAFPLSFPAIRPPLLTVMKHFLKYFPYELWGEQ